MQLRRTAILSLALLCFHQEARAQNVDYYDDYSSFSQDFEELDDESRAIFGKFFQTALYAGTGIFTGELGQANTAGLNVGIRFIYYFDPMWAAEIGGFWAQHTTYYNSKNTGSAVDLLMKTRLMPVEGGLRFAFDTQSMPRGLAQANPYLAVGGVLMFRQESVSGNVTNTGLDATAASKYSNGAIVGSTNFGVQFGAGAEFDVYKSRGFIGLDLRYNMMFWSDSSSFIGQLGRQGSYFTVMGSGSYAY